MINRRRIGLFALLGAFCALCGCGGGSSLVKGIHNAPIPDKYHDTAVLDIGGGVLTEQDPLPPAPPKGEYWLR